MAGPLDFLTSDDAQLGLALLAAAGPTARPMSIGQRLAGAVQQTSAAKEARADREAVRAFRESQIAENKAQTLFKQQELALAAKKQAAIDAWLMGGGDPAAVGGGAPAGGLMGSAPGAAQAGGGGLLSSLTPDRLAAGAVLGVPGIAGVTEAWKLANPELKESNGVFYNPRAVQPGLNREIRDAQLQMRRDEADITGNRQRIEYIDAQGRKRQAWADQIDPRGGGAPAARPSAPMIGPGAGGYGREANLRGLAAGDPDARAYAREAAAIERDLNDPVKARTLTPQDRAAMQAEIARIRSAQQQYGLPNDASGAPLIGPGAGAPAAPVAPAGGPGVVIEEAPEVVSARKAREAGEIEAARQRAQALVDNEKNMGKNFAKQRASVAQADRVMAKVDEALAKTGTLSTGMGSLLAPIPGTSARNLQATLGTIKANLGFSELQAMRDSSPTGGALGAIAVQELDMLQSTVASLDQAQSEEQLVTALGQVKAHLDKWKTTVLNTPIPGAPPAPPPPPPPPPAPAPAPAAAAPRPRGPAVSGRIGDAPASSSGWTPPAGWSVKVKP